MYAYTDAGLRNVWLLNGYQKKKTPYGQAVSIQNLEGLTQAICTALCKKPSKLLGSEFRYLRNGLMLSQASLGQLMGVSSQAIAIWEKSSRIPKMADLLIRVVYMAHTNGDESVKNMVTTLNDSERFTLTLKETSKGWQATLSSNA
ncbi:MAG: hypothetical protein EBV20_06885 [Betaproteobacteria bacterium]|jgi:putative transcriptional regulator|nr:hypothetical protein [Betaproteobacteria bacterium]NBP45355.1 hypothetical protein [Betaproteobacteria bacterium]